MHNQNVRRRKVNSLQAVFISLAAGTAGLAGPAFATHAFNTDTPYASRGACEAATAKFDNEDREWLGAAFPELDLSDGEVRSMLQRAWTCEQTPDGAWYITDHRIEVLDSDWWQRRLPE